MNGELATNFFYILDVSYWDYYRISKKRESLEQIHPNDKDLYWGEICKLLDISFEELIDLFEIMYSC